MKPSIKREQKYYDALKAISKFQTPAQLRRDNFGLADEEVLEYAYENMQLIAKAAIKGMRRPKDNP